jgi:Tfp pilus assembly protein PilN
VLLAWAVLAAAALFLGHQVQARQGAWAALEPSYQRSLEVTTERQRMERAVQQVKGFQQRQPIWDGLLKEVAALIPSALDVAELRVSAEAGRDETFRLHLSGHVAGVSAQGSLAEFIDALERSPFFASVELTSSELHSSGERAQFTLEAVLE